MPLYFFAHIRLGLSDCCCDDSSAIAAVDALLVAVVNQKWYPKKGKEYDANCHTPQPPVCVHREEG